MIGLGYYALFALLFGLWPGRAQCGARSLRAMRNLVVMALCVFLWGQAHGQQMLVHPDGAWLRNGIGLYQRLSASHEKLSEQETSHARAVVSYVCAVVDLERYLVFRTYLLNGAIADARDESHLSAMELKGISEALPLLMPLAKTRFFEDNPSCDRVLLMVRDFLLEHPDLLAGDASMVIEGALLRTYSDAVEP